MGKAGLPDENLSKEQYLEAECKRLDNLYRVAVQEKEAQCQSFRELLLEKENEVQELSKMIEENSDSEKTRKGLEDVLKSAGKPVNGDIEYEQLLSMVTELVQSVNKTGDEKGINDVAEDAARKLGEENEVLSRKCEMLNEKLLKLEASSSPCAQCSKSEEAVNKLTKEIDLLKQTNILETEN